MLMDLNQMRRHGFSDRTREYVRSTDRPPLFYNEQDALNAVFGERWTPLDPVWNALTAVLLPFVEGGSWSTDAHHDAWTLERAARSPAIVHFEGAAMLKPWCARCLTRLRPSIGDSATRRRGRWAGSMVDAGTHGSRGRR